MLEVDDVVPRLDLEGAGWFLGLQHTENLYNSDRHLFAASVGVLWRWIEDQYTALGYALNERSTSILPVSMALSYTGKKADFMGGRNFATVQGLYNVATTGDKLEELWTGAEEHYWIFRWQMARLQPLFGWFDEKRGQDLHQWMIFSKVEGQYTGDTLIPVEKLSMGGYNCMRGYRTRGYIGDYGVYGTTELRTPILVDGFASLFGDRTDKTPIDRLQFLGFMDYGWTAFNDLPSSYDDSEFIYSAGVGVRAALTKYLQFRCDVAFPLRDTDWAEDESMEIYISVQGQF
jgi:hemolysin activation/secretion protein